MQPKVEIGTCLLCFRSSLHIYLQTLLPMEHRVKSILFWPIRDKLFFQHSKHWAGNAQVQTRPPEFPWGILIAGLSALCWALMVRVGAASASCLASTSPKITKALNHTGLSLDQEDIKVSQPWHLHINETLSLFLALFLLKEHLLKCIGSPSESRPHILNVLI